MNSSGFGAAALLCHRSQPCPPLGRIKASERASRRTESRLELEAIMSPELLAGISVYTRLWIAPWGVVDDARGALSYWALRHL